LKINGYIKIKNKEKEGKQELKDKMDYYFKVSEKANIASDEDGNSYECYMKVGLTLKKAISEKDLEKKKRKSEKYAIKTASSLLKIKKKYLKVISEKKFLENTDED